MFTEIPQSISWHYGEFRQWMLNPEYSSIYFIEGLPDMTSLYPTKVNLLIIDDLMHEMNEVVAKLFTKGSHHRNTIVLLLTQNIFHQHKHSRMVNINAHYMVLFIANHQSGQENVSGKREVSEKQLRRCHEYTLWLLVNLSKTRHIRFAPAED